MQVQAKNTVNSIADEILVKKNLTLKHIKTGFYLNPNAEHAKGEDVAPDDHLSRVSVLSSTSAENSEQLKPIR